MSLRRALNDPVIMRAAGSVGIIISSLCLHRAESLGLPGELANDPVARVPAGGNLEASLQKQLEEIERLREENFNIRARLALSSGDLRL